MAVAGDIPHGKQKQHKADRLDQAGQDCHRGTGGAGQPFVVGAGQRVDRGQVDEPGQRQAHPGRVKADIVPMRSGQQGQQHAGHHVALMHTVGQREHTDAVVRRQQQRREAAAPGAAHRKVGQARRDQQDIEPPQLLPGDAQQYRLFQALPVAAQRRHPVESVDGGVRVARHRTCVLFYQLGEQLCDAEKRQPRRQRGQQCQRRTAEAAAKGAELIFFQRDSRQVADRQHRSEQ